jgi:hypothetical protein
MRPDKTVQIDAHAAATLKYIRASMEAAASLAVPGSAGIAMGGVGLLATALSLMLHDHWFAIWLGAAVLAASLGVVFMTGQSSLRALISVGAPLRKFALCLLPSLFAGAVMTAVHWLRGDLHAIPGTWLLLYGCALISASAATNATIGIMGGAFLVLGLLALVLPAQAHLPLLGAGFGGLHVLFGFLIGRHAGGSANVN